MDELLSQVRQAVLESERRVRRTVMCVVTVSTCLIIGVMLALASLLLGVVPPV